MKGERGMRTWNKYRTGFASLVNGTIAFIVGISQSGVKSYVSAKGEHFKVHPERSAAPKGEVECFTQVLGNGQILMKKVFPDGTIKQSIHQSRLTQ